MIAAEAVVAALAVGPLAVANDPQSGLGIFTGGCREPLSDLAGEQFALVLQRSGIGGVGFRIEPLEQRLRLAFIESILLTVADEPVLPMIPVRPLATAT